MNSDPMFSMEMSDQDRDDDDADFLLQARSSSYMI
jgi:hypothetical protein